MISGIQNYKKELSGSEVMLGFFKNLHGNFCIFVRRYRIKLF